MSSVSDQELGAALGFDDLSEIISTGRTYQECDTLKRKPQSEFCEQTVKEWVEQLREADTWCTPIQTVTEALTDPQARHDDTIPRQTIHQSANCNSLES